jgi:hypothetical protein
MDYCTRQHATRGRSTARFLQELASSWAVDRRIQSGSGCYVGDSGRTSHRYRQHQCHDVRLAERSKRVEKTHRTHTHVLFVGDEQSLGNKLPSLPGGTGDVPLGDPATR